VKDCIVLGQEGILDQDLDGEKMGEDRESRCYNGRESFPEMIICNFEVLKSVSDYRSQEVIITLRPLLSPAPPPPWPAQHPHGQTVSVSSMRD
jgi:hypothetical protein